VRLRTLDEGEAPHERLLAKVPVRRWGQYCGGVSQACGHDHEQQPQRPACDRPQRDDGAGDGHCLAGRAHVQLPTLTPEPPLPTPAWLTPSFAEICDQPEVKIPSERTAYAQALAGKQIVGSTGEVYDLEWRDVQSYAIKVDKRGEPIGKNPHLATVPGVFVKGVLLQLSFPFFWRKE
jgi:hypothetical protein